MAKTYFRFAGLVAGALALAGVAAPAQAQFGSILRSGTRAATSEDTGGCDNGKKRGVGSRLLGGLLGEAANTAASRTGVTSWVTVPDVTDQLTDAIACRLDPDEQRQAAQATLDATRSVAENGSEPEIGESAAWTSNTREDVSGTSTVLARNNDERGGLQCITVSDVIIVSGEETRAEKRMCRRPPAARYALAA